VDYGKGANLMTLDNRLWEGKDWTTLDVDYGKGVNLMTFDNRLWEGKDWTTPDSGL
jgi:hypothetical protein